MPEPVKRNQRYMPGLDGLRAIAVLAVIAFHLGFDWAPGGHARRRRLLHPQRLPDHRHPAGAAERPRQDQARPLLAGPRPAPAAGPVPDAGDRRRLGDDLRPSPAGPVPQGRRLGDLLRQQLAADLRRRLLLRPLRSRRPAQPPLVALGRGAVLHRLAVPAAGRGQARPREPAALRRASAAGPADDRRRARLDDPDGGPLRPSLDPSRLYFGTDTRAGGLLFGAALAMVWPSRKLSRRIAPQARNMLDGLGVARPAGRSR